MPLTPARLYLGVDVRPSRNSRYVGILALAATLILIAGWLARPRELPQSPAPIPSQTELEQLARRTERRSLDSMAKYFGAVARDVETSIARVRIAQATGIVWDDARIITAPIPARPTRVDDGAATVYDVDGQPAIGSPNLPFAAVGFDRKVELTPAQRATSVPQSGEWLLAVWRTDSSPAFAPGSFRQTTSSTCGVTPIEEIVSSLAFGEPMIGGGVFNIDGQLVGMVLPCGDRIAAIGIASIQRLLDGADTIEQRIRGRLGLGLAPLSADEQDYFKTTEGLLVREVWTGYPGDIAGVRPGDVVIAFNGADVRTMADMGGTQPEGNAPLAMTVVRGSKRLTITLEGPAVGARSGVESAGTGLIVESSRQSYRIASVESESAAARAGVQAGDRLIRIDQTEPRSLEEVNRLMRPGKRTPTWLEIERRGHRFGMLLR